MSDLALWGLRAAIAVFVSFLVAIAVFAATCRVFRGRPAASVLVRRLRLPVTSFAVLVAANVSLRLVPSTQRWWEVGERACMVMLIAVGIWGVMRALDVAADAVTGRFDISTIDNLRARTIHTQVHLLRRVIGAAIVVVGAVATLLMFSWGRQLGTAILAAGGIIGVVLGVTGRSTIGNIVAGVQVAFVEPIRLDDVVIVEGEFGRIEEITLTYVVVRLWDERCVVTPTSYFVEQPFENWTRRTANLLGTVDLWVDFSTDLAGLRNELERIVRGSDLWDGRCVGLQVTDTSPQAMKVRALVSARDAPTVWDLRCAVREGLIRWLVAQEPSVLARVRADILDISSQDSVATR